MTRIRPIPNTTDPAGLRLELELVLQQPVPGPEQLEGALPLLHTVENVTADQWRDLQVLPLFMDSEILDLAVPSDWREPEWRTLINALPETSRTVRLHPALQQDLIHALASRQESQSRKPHPTNVPPLSHRPNHPKTTAPLKQRPLPFWRDFMPKASSKPRRTTTQTSPKTP